MWNLHRQYFAVQYSSTTVLVLPYYGYSVPACVSVLLDATYSRAHAPQQGALSISTTMHTGLRRDLTVKRSSRQYHMNTAVR